MLDFDLSQIDKTKAFLKRLWCLENDDRPGFFIGYVGPKVRGGRPIRSALFSTEGEETVRERLLDPEKFLRAQLAEIEDRMPLRSDFVPCLCPAFGVVSIPAAFGCEVVWHQDNFPSVKPLRLRSPKELRDIQRPSLFSGETGRILEYTRHFMDKTEGRIPIRLTDIQGPLDSAALIMGHTEFFTAMKTHPREVHGLIQMITEFTIELVKAQRQVVHNASAEFVPSLFEPWIPDGFGVSVSNDACVMISADEHDEFCVPYLNQIADAFGGLFIHSCGNWLHQIPSLARVRRLRGLEFGASETPFTPVTEYFNDRVVLACRVGLHRDIKFKGMADFVAAILKSKKTNRGLFINADITNGLIDDSWPETDLAEIYRLIESS